jgi:DNA polymerase
MNHTDRLRRTLDQLEELLISLQEDGIREVPFEAPLAGRAPGPGAAPARTPASPGARDSTPVKAGLARIASEAAACTRCTLHAGRRRAVPGQGAAAPELVFVGEAPGLEEDRSGQAFVGPAGEMLTRILAAMGLTRDEVFITNVLKCRTPADRTPLPGEVAACKPFLRAQIEALAPRVIVALGPTAAAALAGQDAAPAFTPGAWGVLGQADVLATYHPAYLLDHPEAKAQVWADMKAVLAKLGRPVPARSAPAPKRPH